MTQGRFRWWFAPLGVALFFGLMFGLGAAIPGVPKAPVTRALFLGLPSFVFAAIALGLPRAIIGPLTSDEVGLRPGRRVPLVVISGACAIIAGVALWEALSPTARAASETVAHSLGVGRSQVADALTLLAIGTLAPVGEELFFRGLIYRALRDGLARWVSLKVTVPVGVILSALVFGISHQSEGQIAQLWALVVTGAVLAVAYELSGSLMAPVLIHAINNSFAAVQAFGMAGADEARLLIAVLGPMLPVLAFLIMRGLRRAWKTGDSLRSRPS